MNCDELRSLLYEHHSGELAAEHVTSFEAHLITCQDCTYYLESYSYTVTIARKLPKCGLPSDVESRMRAKLKDHLS